MPKIDDSRRVVVTGVGPICSMGQGADAVWENVRAERVNVSRHQCKVAGELWEEFFLHRMDDFEVGQFVPDQAALAWVRDWKQGERDIDFELLTSAVGLALKDANLWKFPCGDRTGLFLVHENPGLERIVDRVAEETYSLMSSDRLGKNPRPLAVKRAIAMLCQKQGYDTQTFMHLFFVAKMFGIHGYSLFMNNACSSGLFALESAAQAICSGRIDRAVVAGADFPEYVYKYSWFKELNVYAPDGKVKPFAANRDGMVFGDGGAAIVVESLSSARQRNARIYAEYQGGGFGLEGSKVSVPDPTSDQYARCIKSALRDAGAQAQDLDLLVPHGIGEAVTDLYEARQIANAMEGVPVPVTAFKPYVGHNLGNSAILELCILMKCMQHSYTPSILHQEAIDPRVRLTLVRKSESRPIRRALKLSCGFAGYNAAAVFGALS